MKGNSIAKRFDPKLALNSIRTKSTGKTHRSNRNSQFCVSTKESLKSMNTSSNCSQEILDLEKRVALLEEENRAIHYENSILRTENQRVNSEKNELIQKYEQQIQQLQVQLENAKKSHNYEKDLDMPFAGIRPSIKRTNLKEDLEILMNIYKELPTLERPVVHIDFTNELKRALVM